MARIAFLRLLILATLVFGSAPNVAFAQGEVDDGVIGDIDLPVAGAPSLFDWPKAQMSKDFWKSAPSWEKKGVTEWEKGKGWTKLEPAKSQVKPEVHLYGDSVKGDVAVWSAGDDKNNIKSFGAEGAAGFTAGYKDGVKVSGTAMGRAYLVQARAEGSAQLLGDQETGLAITGKVDARIGVEGVAGADVVFSGEKAQLGGSVNAFAGAKAFGQIPLTATLCKLAATGRLKGEVSAGAGIGASGTIEVDWATLKVKLSGSLAATLGLGAGTGGDVYVDLSELVDDPDAVVDCLKGKARALAIAALAAGETLLEEATEVVEAGAVMATQSARSLNRGVQRAKAAVVIEAASLAVGIYNYFAGDDPTSHNPCP